MLERFRWNDDRGAFPRLAPGKRYPLRRNRGHVLILERRDNPFSAGCYYRVRDDRGVFTKNDFALLNKVDYTAGDDCQFELVSAC